jgi:hypothetical protein
MSILDDAIREHLALKRAHGANDVEVKKLEDEAFGPPQRPDEIDPFAEAPTEFLVSPAEEAEEKPAIADESMRGGRRPNIADLQEGPPPEPVPPAGTGGEADVPLPRGETEAAPPSGADAAAGPDVEEQPAGELALPPLDSGPNTQERQAIADQPTEMFDVQAELSGDTSASPPTSPPSPSDEELVEASQEEPRLTPVEPESGELTIKGPDAELADQPPAEAGPGPVTDEHDEYFSEQRLSDELDQALEAPLTDEEELPDFSAAAPPTTNDFAAPTTDEHARSATDDFAAPGTDQHSRPVTDDFAAPATDEGSVPYTDEQDVPTTDERDATPAPEPPAPPPTENDAPAVPTTEEGTAIFDIESEGDDFAEERSIGPEPRTPAPEQLTPPPEPRTPAPEPRTSSPEPRTPAPEQFAPPPPAATEPPAAAEPRPDFDPDTGHEDVLEDTPDFLEDAPEDDDLWFEQKPPKDFDFDD